MDCASDARYSEANDLKWIWYGWLLDVGDRCGCDKDRDKDCGCDKD